MADAQLSVEIKAEIQQFLRNMREAGAVTKQSGSQIDSALSKITGAVAGAFSVSAIVGFGKEVLNATAQYQKFQAVLGNTLGSSALANLKLKELQDFAAKTPFGVNELTGAFVKLANSGFKPTGNEMRKLGDLASSTGKSFDQLAEAIIDAQTGEFERLKEFGVRAKDAGDSVIFTYKGVQTQVEKTSESIRNYITSLGDAEGTSGSMAKISETLGGKISNLGDSWDQMLIVVGGNTEGVFNSAIDIIGDAINSITKYNRELQIASKYKLGNTFIDGLKRFGQNLVTGGIGTTTELQTLGLAVQSASDSVNDFVNKTIRGAKTTADFGKAIASLKTEGDKNLKNIKVPGLALAFKDIYEEGFKALRDARSNFGKEVTKGANFGKSKDKDKKEKAAVLGLPENPAEIIAQYFREVSAANAPAALKIQAPEKVEIVGKKAELEIGQLIDITGLDKLIRDLKIAEAFNDEASKILTSGVVETFSSIGQAIGEAVVNGGNVAQAAGSALLSSLGGVLIQLGELAIGVGIGIKAIKTALESLNPVVAIAAGVALVALGSVFKAGAANIGKSNGGGGGVTAFANGGIISGPTLGLMGEYAGAKSDPEVVAPLSKLKKMLGQQDSSGNPIMPTGNTNTIVLESKTVLRGQDVLIITKAAEAAYNRKG